MVIFASSHFTTCEASSKRQPNLAERQGLHQQIKIFKLALVNMEIIGWVGTALVITAYYPQIHHLFVERCAWGISVVTWLIWLIASVVPLSYCFLRRDLLLGFVQGVNIIAIA